MSDSEDQTANGGTQDAGPWFGPVHYGNKLFEIQDAKRRIALVDSQHDANYIIKACNAYPNLVAVLRESLNASEAYAKATMSMEVATNNFTDSEPDEESYVMAMVRDSNAEKAAATLLRELGELE